MYVSDLEESRTWPKWSEEPDSGPGPKGREFESLPPIIDVYDYHILIFEPFTVRPDGGATRLDHLTWLTGKGKIVK